VFVVVSASSPLLKHSIPLECYLHSVLKRTARTAILSAIVRVGGAGNSIERHASNRHKRATHHIARHVQNPLFQNVPDRPDTRPQHTRQFYEKCTTSADMGTIRLYGHKSLSLFSYLCRVPCPIHSAALAPRGAQVSPHGQFPFMQSDWRRVLPLSCFNGNLMAM
jgi:hypothetical protein